MRTESMGLAARAVKALAQPACAVLAPLPLTLDWQTAIENAGFRIETGLSSSPPGPDALIVFAGFVPGGVLAARSNCRAIPVLFVTNSGSIVLTDRKGDVHLLPDGCPDKALKLLAPRRSGSTELIGKSDICEELRLRILRVAASDSNVLIAGESGTGKELVAAMLHEYSSRSGPIVSVNCAAIPDSLLESELFGHERGAFTGASHQRDGAFIRANGGTLFLDEIGDMSLYAQAKLLRVLESRRVARLGAGTEQPINVRVVAASNRDLDQMMRKGTFRQDLYFRLVVIEIAVPPLRARTEDIQLLTNHFARTLGERLGCAVQGVSDSVLGLLKNYSWPGNIRELKNLVEAALVSCTGPQIEVQDLPETFFQRLGLPRVEERGRILTILKSVNGNKSLAAKRLHCSRVTLYRKLSRYQIDYPSTDTPDGTEFKLH